MFISRDAFQPCPREHEIRGKCKRPLFLERESGVVEKFTLEWKESITNKVWKNWRNIVYRIGLFTFSK